MKPLQFWDLPGLYRKAFAKNSSCLSIASVPWLGGSSDSHSYLDNPMHELLWGTIFGIYLEDHLGLNLESGGMSSYDHATICLCNISASRTALIIVGFRVQFNLLVIYKTLSNIGSRCTSKCESSNKAWILDSFPGFGLVLVVEILYEGF